MRGSHDAEGLGLQVLLVHNLCIAYLFAPVSQLKAWVGLGGSGHLCIAYLFAPVCLLKAWVGLGGSGHL